MAHAKRQESGTSPPVTSPPVVSSSPPVSPSSSPPSSSPPPSSSTPPPPSQSDPPPPPPDSGSATPSNGGGANNSSNPGPTPSGASASLTPSASGPSQTQGPSQSSTPRAQTQMSTSFSVGTNSAGQVFTSTVVSITVITPSIEPVKGGSTTTSNSHVGPIVGGVIGGIALLVAIIFAATWWVRKRGHHDDFDGDFDPDRVTPGKATGQDLDLTGGAAEVTPYSYGQAQGLGGIGVEPQMSQQQPYGVPGVVSPVSPTGSSSVSGYSGLPPTGFNTIGHPPSSFPPAFNQPTGPSAYPTSGPSAPSAYSEPSAYSGSEPSNPYPDYAAYTAYNAGSVVGQHPGGTGPQDYRHPSPGPSLALDGSEQSSSGRGVGGLIPSSKEREAMAERLHVANEPGASGPSATSPVVQHLDGGRLLVPVAEAPPQEIPPSYDSIPRAA